LTFIPGTTKINSVIPIVDSNGNHNGYLQVEAKFMIFRILKFPKVRCIQ